MPTSPSPAEPKPRGSCLPVALVLCLATLLFGAMVVLSNGRMLPAAVAAAAIFGAVALPYLVWGWWLSRYIHDKEGRGEDSGVGGQGKKG